MNGARKALEESDAKRAKAKLALDLVWDQLVKKANLTKANAAFDKCAEICYEAVREASQ